MDRAVLALALVACGARTDLGGARGDASAAHDASNDVVFSDASPDAPLTHCPPVEYTNDDQDSTVLVVDNGSVYFMSKPCVVGRMSKEGGIPQLWNLGVDCAGEIAIDDKNVYFTNAAGHLERFLKDGQFAIEDLGCAALNGCPGNVHVRAVAQDVVVLVDGFRPVAMPKVAGPPYPLIASGVSPPAPVHYVFVDDTRAYWNNDIRVFSTALDFGATPLQYAAASTGLAIDFTHVFWTANDKGKFDLFRADKDGTDETVLSSSDTSTPLVAGNAHVYGASPSGITKQPTSGGAPAVVIVPNVHPLTLALDDACVYFAEKTSNGRRVARAEN